MKIQFASDLHLEMQDNSRWLKHNPLPVVGDILVLAGDIIYLGNEALFRHPFWDWASQNYREVLAVPGNHEFYAGFDLQPLQNGWMMEVRPNVHYYYNVCRQIEDVEFIMTTLWSMIPVQDAFITEQYVSDFRRIKSGGKVIDFARFNEEHLRCKEFLEQLLSKPKFGYRLVVSHHLPSFALIDPQFKGSRLNGAFAAELFDLIADSDIDCWIYGHSHRNIETKIGSCQCYCNQLGYVTHGEHTLFDGGRVIDLN